MSDWSAEVEEDFERRSQVEFTNFYLSKDEDTLYKFTPPGRFCHGPEFSTLGVS